MRKRPTEPRPNRLARVAVVLATLVALTGCASAAGLSQRDERVQVVTTTGLLRDLVQNVGGDRVNVTSLVPDNGDPHSYEPTLRDVRDVVYADLAFSNYMLLEQHSVIKALDANLGRDVPNVSLAEDAVKYAAEIIPLVENVNLDTIWLGLRARGKGVEHGADRSSEVRLSATAATGPGDVYGYLTGSFGEAEVYFDSSDGFDATTGYRDDTARLPLDAHTHMSWVFTEPGIYTVSFAAGLQVEATSRPIPLGQSTFTFAVGVDPATVRDATQGGSTTGTTTQGGSTTGGRTAQGAAPFRGTTTRDGATGTTAPGARRPTVLDQGHADLTVDLDRGEIYALYDPSGGGEHAQAEHRPEDTVIAVPSKAIAEVPSGRQFSFLGRAGEQIYQLPQAVLGKHVHGEIDPHLWQDVGNAIAYAKLIRDTLIERDPQGAKTYRANADAYLAELDALDRYVRRTIAAIPKHRRHLVTTHDAFAYLAHAYGLQIAGFVTPNPATEPSLAERRKLTETIRNLDVPAVFLEPNLAARSSTLTEVAREQDVRVCPIYGDTFDGTVTTYVQMMRFNAGSLKRCLS